MRNILALGRKLRFRYTTRYAIQAYASPVTEGNRRRLLAAWLSARRSGVIFGCNMLVPGSHCLRLTVTFVCSVLSLSLRL